MRHPVLCITGGQSPAHLRSSTEAVASACPQATLVEIDHVEHSGHLEDPMTIAAAIRDWAVRLPR